MFWTTVEVMSSLKELIPRLYHLALLKSHMNGVVF